MEWVTQAGSGLSFFRVKRSSLFFSIDDEEIKSFCKTDYRSQKSTRESNQNVEIKKKTFSRQFLPFWPMQKGQWAVL